MLQKMLIMLHLFVLPILLVCMFFDGIVLFCLFLS